MWRGERATRWVAGVIGLVLAVVMVWALHVYGAAAPDAEPSPAMLEEITARTVAALQARYAVEVRVRGAGDQVLSVREEGAFDRPSARAWTETSWSPPEPAGRGASRVIERVRIVGGALYLQPRLAGPGLGLPPAAWLAADVGETQGLHLVDGVARSLGGLGDELSSLASGTGRPAVRRAGHERLGGISTTHLTVTRRGDTADLWIDGHHRVRRLDIVHGAATARLDLSYGEPVTVERPTVTETATADAATVLRAAAAALADGGPPEDTAEPTSARGGWSRSTPATGRARARLRAPR